MIAYQKIGKHVTRETRGQYFIRTWNHDTIPFVIIDVAVLAGPPYPMTENSLIFNARGCAIIHNSSFDPLFFLMSLYPTV